MVLLLNILLFQLWLPTNHPTNSKFWVKMFYLPAPCQALEGAATIPSVLEDIMLWLDLASNLG
nr:ADM_HP1_G0015360.mRNA.1.CDS.1 [Saccharomyces cerevisiae]